MFSEEILLFYLIKLNDNILNKVIEIKVSFTRNPRTFPQSG
jgi:hypothetical protein